MTSLLQELPARQDSLTAGLHASLDELAGLDFVGFDADGQAQVLASLVRAEARIAALRLRVLAVAEQSRTAARTGAANTGQWAARIVHADPVAAHRQVALAQRLSERTTTQRALSSGVISTEHAAVIVAADRQLPRGLTPAQRSMVEAGLVSKAQSLSPTALRRAARRALELVEADPSVVDAHEDELVACEEERARAKTRLTLHENGDGTVTGHFTVPVFHGHPRQRM